MHLHRMAGETDGHLPLVMLHASPASSTSLLPIIREMPPSRDVIAFDTPCNGHSCAPAMDDPEISDFADMLDRACDATGLDELAIYGTHTGAHIAIAWALARPGRVKGLALDGVALLDADLRQEMLAQYAPPQRPDETGSQFHWAWQYIRDQMIFFPHYRKDAEHRREGGVFDARLLHELVLDVLNNLESYHMPYRAVFRHEVRADLKRLALPTLVLRDGGGPLDPASRELSSLVAHAKLADRCGSPAAKAAAIQSFVSELGNE